MTEDEQGFQAPQTITPDGLADDLTVLVSEWEGSSELAELNLVDENGHPDKRAAEEALIFLMWAHTRGTQQAFLGRATPELLKQALDGLHDAVLEDMVDNGTPRAHLQRFEKRVSKPYAQYHTAAAASDAALGEAVVHHLTESSDPSEPYTKTVTERAVEVTGPLRDYLEDVQLIP